MQVRRHHWQHNMCAVIVVMVAASRGCRALDIAIPTTSDSATSHPAPSPEALTSSRSVAAADVVKRVVHTSWWPPANDKFEEAVGVVSRGVCRSLFPECLRQQPFYIVVPFIDFQIYSESEYSSQS